MINVYLFWVLVALLMVLSSVLWCNTYHSSLFDHLSMEEIQKMGAKPSIDAAFGFPGPFLSIRFTIDNSASMVIRAIDFSLPNFIIDFVFYFVILAVPFLIARERIIEHKKL